MAPNLLSGRPVAVSENETLQILRGVATSILALSLLTWLRAVSAVDLPPQHGQQIAPWMWQGVKKSELGNLNFGSQEVRALKSGGLNLEV